MIYVLSDIHGQRRRFESILKQINLQPEDTLYVLGDVIDRNPDGIKILRQIMAMPNAKMLLGNHELMMLDALYFVVPDRIAYPDEYLDRALRIWYNNGGGVTHNYLKRIKISVRQEIFDFLADLPLNYNVTVNGQDYILAHAAPAFLYYDHPGKYRDERDYAVWKRFDYNFPKLENATVIFGHTTTNCFQTCNPMELWYGNGWIGIDCGSSYPEKGDEWSGYYGRLACLRLDDMKVFYSEEPFAPDEEGDEHNE